MERHTRKRTEIMDAYKKEKNSRVKTRLQAVCHVLKGDKSISEAAATAFDGKNSTRVGQNV